MVALAEFTECFKCLCVFDIHVCNGACDAVVIVELSGIVGIAKSVGISSLLPVALEFLACFFEMGLCFCPCLLRFGEIVPIFHGLVEFWELCEAGDETVGEASVGDSMCPIP